jgi:hypothetical protein
VPLEVSHQSHKLHGVDTEVDQWLIERDLVRLEVELPAEAIDYPRPNLIRGGWNLTGAANGRGL